MKRLQGKLISPSYGAGTAVALEAALQAVPRRAIWVSQVRTGGRRLKRALVRSIHEFEQMHRRVLHELGRTHAAVFEAQLGILNDPTPRDCVEAQIDGLTQYLLAADRGATDTDEDGSIHNPAVLRTIRAIVAQGISANKPASACGEAARDTQSACLLARLGVRQLSMSSVRAALVRESLRGVSMARCLQRATNLTARRRVKSGGTCEVRSRCRPCTSNRTDRTLSGPHGIHALKHTA